MFKRLVWALLILGCLAFWTALGHAWATWHFATYETKLAECRGDANEANEHRNQLLSGGRFVRKFDSKTGASIYTFAKRGSK